MTEKERLVKIKKETEDYFYDKFISTVKEKMLNYGIDKIEFSCEKGAFNKAPTTTETIRLYINALTTEPNHVHFYIDKSAESKTSLLHPIDHKVRPEYISKFIEAVSKSLEKATSSIDLELKKAEDLFNKMKGIHDPLATLLRG